MDNSPETHCIADWQNLESRLQDHSVCGITCIILTLYGDFCFSVARLPQSAVHVLTILTTELANHSAGSLVGSIIEHEFFSCMIADRAAIKWLKVLVIPCLPLTQ